MIAERLNWLERLGAIAYGLLFAAGALAMLVLIRWIAEKTL